MAAKYPVNQRVRDLMRELGYPKNVDGFYKKYFGEGRSEKLRTVFNDDNQIKTDFLVEIASKVAEIDGKKVNGHWLLTGEGEMFLTEKHTAATKGEEAAVSREREELLKDLDAFRSLAIHNAQTILNLSAGGGAKTPQEA